MISILFSSASALPSFTVTQAGQTSKELFCGPAYEADYHCPEISSTWPRPTGVYTCTDICKLKNKPSFCSPNVACKIRLRYDSSSKDKTIMAYKSNAVQYATFWIEQSGTVSGQVACSSKTNPYYGCKSGKDLWKSSDAMTCVDLCARADRPRAICKANIACKAPMRYDEWVGKSKLLPFKILANKPTKPPVNPTKPPVQPDNRCAARSGECGSRSSCNANWGYKVLPGLCPGSSDNVCCVYDPTPVNPPKPPVNPPKPPVNPPKPPVNPPTPKDTYFHVYQDNMVTDNIQCHKGSNSCMPPAQVWLKEGGIKYKFDGRTKFACTDLCKTQHASALACGSGYSCKVHLSSSSYTVVPGARMVAF